MKYTYLLLLLCAMFLISCNGKADKTGSTSPAPAAAQQPAQTGPQLGSIEMTTLEKLFKQGTSVDYIFHNHPFSMSQSDRPSIQAALTYFSSETLGAIPANCKPIARQMFQIQGEIVHEFDIYYSDNCKFFVEMVNEKPASCNKMTPAGDEFFKKVIAQAMNQGQQLHGN